MKPLFKRRGSRLALKWDANGKVLSKHNEAKEHKKEGSTY
jgi:YD repeat-containing protein